MVLAMDLGVDVGMVDMVDGADADGEVTSALATEMFTITLMIADAIIAEAPAGAHAEEMIAVEGATDH